MRKLSVALSRMSSIPSEMQEPSIDTDKLSYEIFSVLESKFLFGYDDQKLWIPKQISPATSAAAITDSSGPAVTVVGGGTGAEVGNITSMKNQRGKVCILSVDGGGMRGIVAGKALAYLEQALKAKSGNPDARIADYFDVAAGTAIGGIFTAMLFATKEGNRPIFHAEDTWKFLAEKGKKFYRTSASSGLGLLPKCLTSSGGDGGFTAGLERAMKDAFTERDRCLTLKDTLKPMLIPCYDLSSAAPFLFSRADALEADSFDFRLWEVCRATSAEPGIFDPVAMSSVDGSTRCLAVDGGLAMSNPAAAAITHVLHNKQEFPFVRGVEDLMVLSLGSGGGLLEAGYNFEQVKGWRTKEWAKPMARIASDGAADLVDHAVAMAFGQCRSSNYVRIQASGANLCRFSASADSDPSPSNVKMLLGVAEDVLKQKNVESVLFGGRRIGEQTNYEKLDWFAGQLVLEHQRRSSRIAPTVAFKQVSPRAP